MSQRLRKQSSTDRLINLGTAALGVGCIIAGYLIPPAAAILGPLGGTLIGMAMKQPSAMLVHKPTPPPVPPGG